MCYIINELFLCCVLLDKVHVLSTCQQKQAIASAVQITYCLTTHLLQRRKWNPNLTDTDH